MVLLATLLTGCSLEAKPFGGTVIQMTLTGVAPDAPGQHLELWARNEYDDVLRVSGTFDNADGRLFTYGLGIRAAIRMDDPCMIDGAGNLLTKAEAYQPTSWAGVPQTPEEQAQQVRSRIAQLTAASSCDGSGGDPAYHCGHETTTVLGVIGHESTDEQGGVLAMAPAPLQTCETSNNAAGCISYAAKPADRLAACGDYWRNPLAYTPNPLQLTAPQHGVLYGEPTYVTTTPPSSFDSIRIDSNVGLKGIRELWLTVEQDPVDPQNRGPILVTGTPDPGGIDVVHFDLTPPFGSTVAVSGTASLLDTLDEDPVQF
jgi:hypothetical protein